MSESARANEESWGLPVMFLVARNGAVDARMDGGTELHALEDHMKQIVFQH
jgi:hypothetical protein